MMKPARALLAALVLAVPYMTVAATAHAAGPQTTLDLSFQAQGPVAQISVRPGDHVRLGQLLAQVDARQAMTGVATAEAGVMNARAALLQLTAGQSRSERAQNRAAVATAAAGLRAAIRARADGLAMARRTIAQKRRALAQARGRLALAEAAAAQNALDLQAAVDQARALLALAAGTDGAGQARDAVTNALNTQASGAISDRQAIADATAAVANAADDLASGITDSRSADHQAVAAVKAARLALRSTRAANAVAAQPPRADALLQARAGLRTAQAGLQAARLTLAQTQLRAPAAGIIVTVDGHVGEAPAQSGGGFITMMTFASR